MQLKIGQRARIVGRKTQGSFEIDATVIYLGGNAYQSENEKVRDVIADIDIEPVSLIDWEAIQYEWCGHLDGGSKVDMEGSEVFNWFQEQITKQLK